MTDLSRQLAEWSAAEAAAERSRERSLRQQAAESATLAGLFIDMAERGETVAVVLAGTSGNRAGEVTSVGADFVVLDRTFIPFAAIASVRGPKAAGDRTAHGLTFLAALSRLAEDRPDVAVTVDGGDVVSGELQAASDELLTLSTAWVPLGAVRALSLV